MDRGEIQCHSHSGAILHKMSVLDESDEATKRLNSVIDTNLTGVVHCTREGIRIMRKSNEHGIIINVGSIAGHSVYAGLHISNIYSPTKHGITAFSEVVRQELIVGGNHNIRVTNLSPGVVKTNIMIAGKAYESEADYENVPHLKAEDVSESVLFILETPWSVNVSQLTIKPVGERK